MSPLQAESLVAFHQRSPLAMIDLLDQNGRLIAWVRALDFIGERLWLETVGWKEPRLIEFRITNLWWNSTTNYLQVVEAAHDD